MLVTWVLGDSTRRWVQRAGRLAVRSAQAVAEERVRIAPLVVDGATSKEAVGQLYLSPRTVDAHLRNIVKNLGLTSRRQLRDLRLEIL